MRGRVGETHMDVKEVRAKAERAGVELRAKAEKAGAELRTKAEKAGVQLLSLAAGVSGPLWVNHRKFEYRPGSRYLSENEKVALAGFFSEELLEQVRVAEVGCIKAPWVCRAAAKVRVARSVWPELLAGLALDDLIVVRQEGTKETPMPLLFHELVHVVQYRVLGVRGFTRTYIREWAKAGFDYLSLPMEMDAFEMQARYQERPEDRFKVEEVVRARLDRRVAA